VCDTGSAMFIDQQACLEPVKRIGRGDLVGPVIGNQVGKDMT
jgi:hypothetical protein